MPDEAPAQRPLRFGEALPRIRAASNRNPQFALGSMGGRFVLLCVIADANAETAKAALTAIAAHQGEETVRLCAVASVDANAAPATLAAAVAGKLVFHDPPVLLAAGLHDPAGAPAGRWILFDPSQRVLGLWLLEDAAGALQALAQTPTPDAHAGTPLHAPVLIAPRIFEPEFCKRLIEHYRDHGGTPSGVTQENAEGKTIVRLQDDFKRRRDVLIADQNLRDGAMHRIFWRLAPEIEKAFMWRPTRMERYLVACYDADGGGFFKPHRDNTTKGTAHRRFAVTINLNAGEYEGGDLRFPEFGSKTYRAPTGGAVVFACSLLHEATPVTRGQRYAFVPFLYDDDGAKLRAENEKYLDESIRADRGARE
ncbi:MAG: 2OG-Fe(II) oxygenase [Hyphomonadaceae bacterium]